MFDRTVIVARPARAVHHHHTTTVIEKRAPTDESVKLLREMEGAARAEVLDSIKIGNTIFECVVHSMRDALSGDILLKAVFSLNGKKMTADTRMAEHNRPTPQATYEALVKVVADKIAAEIVRPALVALLSAPSTRSET